MLLSVVSSIQKTILSGLSKYSHPESPPSTVHFLSSNKPREKTFAPSFPMLSEVEVTMAAPGRGADNDR